MVDYNTIFAAGKIYIYKNNHSKNIYIKQLNKWIYLLDTFYSVTSWGLHAIVLKTKTTICHSFLSFCPVLQLCIPHLFWHRHTVFYRSCLFKAPQCPLIGQLTHAWPSPANSNRAAVHNQFLWAKPATRQKMCKCVTLWCHKVTELKAGLLTKHFRSSVFCWREELLLVGTF